MSCIVEAVQQGRAPQAETLHGNLVQIPNRRDISPADFEPVGLQPPHLQTSRHRTATLAISFALLIGMMLGIGYWASYSVAKADRMLEGAFAARTAKLQLAYEAQSYSVENSRIIMQLFVQRGNAPDFLLVRRAQNSQKIIDLIDRLRKESSGEKERELISAVSRTRSAYVNSYQRALKLLIEGKDIDAARQVMLHETSPALFAYQAAWQEFEALQLQQMKLAAAQSSEWDAGTQRLAMILTWLAAGLAAAIALFTTRRMARDLTARTRMQEKVTALNAELEGKVAKRTEELARAHGQLEEVLAETQEYAKEIEAVNDLVKLLQSCLTMEEACRQASCVLQQFFKGGEVLMLNSSRNLLDRVLSWGTASASRGPFPPESCWALRKGVAHLAGPHSQTLACGHNDGDSGCHLCIPMIAQGAPIGVLTIHEAAFCNGRGDSEVATRKQKLAATLSEQISLSFANLMLRETLKYQSVRDPLTGLFNRRHMEEMLDREVLRSARNSNPVTVLMIDIDHFKRFNDTYGHEAGDALLREMGAALKSQVRGGDIACRYGGEEFLLILSETDVDSGRKRAEALRQQISALQIRYHGEMLRQITASIGLACFPVHGNSAADVTRAADAALYQAKREGRDRVIVATT